ncbi:MAG TPA: YicC/YloC family endoribonuclease [Phenylobacterium sp.]|nr:YicC/YloC family endoribonuclease [Phenylobacterium sp.]
MPLSGMTGFGRAEGALGDWSWAVEARSVNGRNLEVRFRGPPTLEGLDRAAREAAQARFQRGQLNLGLQASKAETARGVRVNTEQLEAYLALAARYVEAGQVAKPTIEGLLALRGVLDNGGPEETPEDLERLQAAILASLAAALDALKADRLQEGAALTEVLRGLIDRIEALVGLAESEAATQPLFLKEKFARRLEELLGDRSLSEDRIVQEAAILAQKADVREELDRLKSHVQAARALIAGEGASGRKLDFLTQEFMREANTLCSKAGTNALTALGLELKAVVDQLREQVQNVE